MLVIGPPELLVEQEEEEAVLPHHSTPVKWGRMVTWLYRYCQPLPPSEPKELSRPSCMLLLRVMALAGESVEVYDPWFPGGAWP